jgi:hypothetical protein
MSLKKSLEWDINKAPDIVPLDLDREIENAKQCKVALERLLKELLEPGVDFDKVPGAKKAGLLKSGAELICQVFRFSAGKTDMISQVEDRDAGYYSYVIGTPIIHTQSRSQVAYGIGAANSYEPKYRYRYNSDGSKSEHPDPAELQNTLVKMAGKRSYVGGVLLATGADRIFVAGDADELIPASKKTLNYMKYNSFKGVAKDVMLADIKTIIGRDIKEVDELSQDEAGEVIEAKKAATADQKQKPDKTEQQKPPSTEPLAAEDQLIVIGDEQQRLVWSDEKLSYNLQKHLKVDHPSKLTVKQAESIIRQMQAMQPAAPVAPGGKVQESLFSD